MPKLEIFRTKKSTEKPHYNIILSNTTQHNTTQDRTGQNNTTISIHNRKTIPLKPEYNKD